MNKSLYMKALNMVKEDCEKCPFVHEAPGKCPSEDKNGVVGLIATCAKAVYLHLLKKGRGPRNGEGQ